MITLIAGRHGSGKTRRMVEMANQAAKETKGFVVCVDKGTKLNFDLNFDVKLINIDSYLIKGYDSFYGFISGICAGNYDVTDIFIDSTMKIGGKDIDLLTGFIAKLNVLAKETQIKITLTVPIDKEELPKEITDICTVA